MKQNTLTNFNINAFTNNFKNSENHPDFVGSTEIEGKPYKIALWEKKDKNGKPYFAISFSENNYKKQEKPNTNEEELDNPFGL